MEAEKQRMAVFDLDGTLLNNSRAISRQNFKALQDLNENGYEVVLASGRPEILMRVYYLGLPFIRYVLSSNGGMIRDCKRDHSLRHCPISQESVHKIMAICDRNQAPCDLYSHGGMSFLPTDELDRDLTDEIVFDFKNLILKDRNMSNFPCEKIFVHEKDPDRLERLRAEIANQVGDVDISQSSFQALDIMAQGVNKGTGLAWLARFLKIRRENIVSFGDHLNDKEMLAYAGISIVCSNAVAAVKEIATYVLPETNHENGVAAGIYRYILKTTGE